MSKVPVVKDKKDEYEVPQWTKERKAHTVTWTKHRCPYCPEEFETGLEKQTHVLANHDKEYKEDIQVEV